MTAILTAIYLLHNTMNIHVFPFLKYKHWQNTNLLLMELFYTVLYYTSRVIDICNLIYKMFMQRTANLGKYKLFYGRVLLFLSLPFHFSHFLPLFPSPIPTFNSQINPVR